MSRNVQSVAVSEYLADHLGQLKLVARDSELKVLAYLIEMAEIQAHDDKIQLLSGLPEEG